MTHNLSEAKNHDCRPHSRGSVRRASGFVLTGNPDGILLKLALMKAKPRTSATMPGDALLTTDEHLGLRA